MLAAILRRIPVMSLRSTSPHREKSGRGTEPAPGAEGAAAAFLMIRLTKFLTSSPRMRPAGPEPGTCSMVTPSSRASRRTVGVAGTGRWAGEASTSFSARGDCNGMGLVSGTATAGSSPEASRAVVFSGAGRSRTSGGVSRAGWLSSSRVRISCPTLTFSPTCT